MSLSSTVLVDDLDSPPSQYAVHVKYNDRWVCATYMGSLRDAELVAEAAHRRSGLAIEIRTAERELVMAFEPAARAARV